MQQWQKQSKDLLDELDKTIQDIKKDSNMKETAKKDVIDDKLDDLDEKWESRCYDDKNLLKELASKKNEASLINETDLINYSADDYAGFLDVFLDHCDKNPFDSDSITQDGISFITKNNNGFLISSFLYFLLFRPVYYYRDKLRLDKLLIPIKHYPLKNKEQTLKDLEEFKFDDFNNEDLWLKHYDAKTKKEIYYPSFLLMLNISKFLFYLDDAFYLEGIYIDKQLSSLIQSPKEDKKLDNLNEIGNAFFKAYKSLYDGIKYGIVSLRGINSYLKIQKYLFDDSTKKWPNWILKMQLNYLENLKQEMNNFCNSIANNDLLNEYFINETFIKPITREEALKLQNDIKKNIIKKNSWFDKDKKYNSYLDSNNIVDFSDVLIEIALSNLCAFCSTNSAYQTYTNMINEVLENAYEDVSKDILENKYDKLLRLLFYFKDIRTKQDLSDYCNIMLESELDKLAGFKKDHKKATNHNISFNEDYKLIHDANYHYTKDPIFSDPILYPNLNLSYEPNNEVLKSAYNIYCDLYNAFYNNYSYQLITNLELKEKEKSMLEEYKKYKEKMIEKDEDDLLKQLRNVDLNDVWKDAQITKEEVSDSKAKFVSLIKFLQNIYSKDFDLNQDVFIYDKDKDMYFNLDKINKKIILDALRNKIESHKSFIIRLFSDTNIYSSLQWNKKTYNQNDIIIKENTKKQKIRR